jgi:hypothetical protein
MGQPGVVFQDVKDMHHGGAEDTEKAEIGFGFFSVSSMPPW